jgi:cobalamin biosynthesis Co2+ chelatase CbiK
MRIIFKKSYKEYYYYVQALPFVPYDEYERGVKEVKILLKNTFKSVRIPGNTITFEDPADEAFFLVWGSDGIEIEIC